MLRLCLALTLLCAGCGSYRVRDVAAEPLAGLPSGSATVCVVRQRADDGTDSPSATVPVWDNGVIVGATRAGSHFCYPVEPGRHVITSEAVVTAEQVVFAAPGERVFVLQEVDGGYYRRRVYSGYRTRQGNSVSLELLDAAHGEALRRATVATQVVEVPRATEFPQPLMIGADPK